MSASVRQTFEFADRVYVCDYCGSMQPGEDKTCPDCGRALFTWAGFLGQERLWTEPDAPPPGPLCSSCVQVPA